MANQLGMDKVQAIFALHEVGWSNRRIARELGIHRTTVAGYLETRGDSKPTGPPSGRCPPTGSDEAHERSRSLCEPYCETILQKLGQRVPLERFPLFHEAQRKVHRDGHVSVEKAYGHRP